MKIGFVLLLVFSLSSCATKIDKTVVNTDKVIDNKFVVESNTDFKLFWNQFRRTVLSKNKTKVVKMVSFPFKDGFNDIYDVTKSLTCNSEKEFLTKYDLIFDNYVIKAIEMNSYRGYDSNYKEGGDIIGKEDFLLTTSNITQPKDLVFKKINNKYYLTGIQYYQ